MHDWGMGMQGKCVAGALCLSLLIVLPAWCLVMQCKGKRSKAKGKGIKAGRARQLEVGLLPGARFPVPFGVFC